MQFRNAWVLALLVVPAALLLWVWLRRFQSGGQSLVLTADHAHRRRGWGLWLAVSLAESMAPVALAAAVFLLAGPLISAVPRDQRKLSNIQFCLDISGSMTAPFGDGDRYDAAMKAVTDFVDHRKGDAYGLTFFGSNYLHWVPLTFDASAIKCAPPFMKPMIAPYWVGGGTEIAKALQGCKKLLESRPDGDRMILLVTDGFSSDLPSVADELAKELKDANIVVFAVLIDVGEIQDEIIDVTRKTGGDAFKAGDPDALKTVFARIDQLKPVEVEKRVAESVDYFEPFLYAGLSALGLLALASLGLRYTPW